MVETVRGRSAVPRKYVLPQMVCSCFCASNCLNIEGTVDGGGFLIIDLRQRQNICLKVWHAVGNDE